MTPFHVERMDASFHVKRVQVTSSMRIPHASVEKR